MGKTRRKTRRIERSSVPIPQTTRNSFNGFWISVFLFSATILVYANVRHFAFVNFDDPEYVTNNLHVQGGLTWQAFKWAFTSGDAANWFPLTWLSHMLDFQLFGLASGWHHITSVLVHALATVLLFAFLNRATRALWPSALVAFLFALHPLHVESVAWVSERKDVLSAFFWCLTLYAYVRYTERQTIARYGLVLVAFCLGLMAKPMIVTLPFVLLLLDVWPFQRLSLRSAPATWPIWEKLPLLLLAVGVSVVTYFVQRGSGAVESVFAFPIGLRIENALLSYAVYLAKIFWPTGLAVFYPYPLSFSAWQVALAVAIVVGISTLVLRLLRTHPYLAVGWFWYLGTLIPVIGLVQVGAQARADRYTYVPAVGIFIMLAWGAADIARRWPRTKLAVPAVAAVACAACVPVTWKQIQYWDNSETLFQHAIDVTNQNYLAQHNLANALLDVPGRLPDAIAHLKESLRIHPDSARTHTDLGTALSKLPAHSPEAVAEYEAALRIDPNSAITHNDLGNTLSKMPGRLPEAISEYEAALRIKPDYAEAHNNLGAALSKSGRPADAVTEFETALKLDPDYPEARKNCAAAHYDLGVGLSKLPGRLPEAISQFEEALRIDPGYAEAHNDLGVALSEMGGRTDEAIAHFEAALRINPNYFDAHYDLAVALSEIPGRLPEAITQLDEALRIRPDPEVQQLLDRMRSSQKRIIQR
ncbi:MAG: tetratricopeptide repeat protein [Acidobacteriota bacterium]|nr:tetratricopeptide repeat protein [Acidobacteriota bacterium]